MRQNILIFAGIIGVLAGVVFMLQGAGILRAPADSFMIDDGQWITNGAILAVLSLILIGGARLVPTRAEEKARKKAEKEARATDAE
ncbi:hypothetical protein [Stakelama tenebrarum]|uniref:Uncharacterized protein n=1 Tax=Stakelama tenebrarum TaxID=2711215 RepID=A0A6G6Y094_9SPHN|nr:hypothetical protein [Sphingosinithalassobacter tenebrarum]QIG78329.1 hypothetical protein G5C33_12045 [Sphingosinithalassobacter tenebrarum]